MASKLWPHVLRPTKEARVWLEAGATGIKGVGDHGLSNEFGPGITTIGREISHYREDPGREITGENLRHLDPIVAARLFVDTQREKYRLNPNVLYWEGVNEPQWNWKEKLLGIEDMEWYAAFEIERIFLLKAIGLRAVIGNFSTGIPDIGDERGKLDLWEAFLPALRTCRDNNGILGLHEYEDKPFSRLENKTKDQNTGREIEWDGEGWNVFRCVKVHRLVLQPSGLGDLNVVLTEFGINFRERPEINYADELVWADRQFRKYPWLLGVCVYTFGQFSGWQPYNLEGSQEAITVAKYIETERNVVDMPTLPPGDPDPLPPPPPMALAQGIDVSHHQGKIDWQRVAAGGMSFAMIRVCDGLGPLDTRFTENWQGSKVAGLVRGAYQFFRPSLNAAAQAELFLDRLGILTSGDFPPCLDVEVTGDQDPADVFDAVRIWIEIVIRRTNLKPIVYTSPGFWNRISKDTLQADLWVAHWTINLQPLIPAAWATWRIWQYTNKGSVTGINGFVDFNRYNGTVKDMRAYVGSLVPAPMPENNLGEMVKTAQDAVRRAQVALDDVESILRKIQ